MMFMAAAINFVDRGSLSVALPLIAAEMSFSPEAQGALLSAFFWTYAVMQIPMGWAVDRFDPKWVYAGAYALWSVACGITGLSGGLVAFVLIRMLLGVGESAYFATSTKMVSQLFPPAERGLPTGLFECGTSVGLAAGTVLTAYLSQEFGWRVMFAVIGFSGLGMALPVDPFRAPRERTPYGIARRPAESARCRQTVRDSQSKSGRRMRWLLLLQLSLVFVDDLAAHISGRKSGV